MQFLLHNFIATQIPILFMNVIIVLVVYDLFVDVGFFNKD